MLLQFGALGVTMSWDEGFPGARASRPHQAWHSLGHLPHLDQPGTAPWLSFGLADGVLAHRVAVCSIALKLSGAKGTGCGRDARAPRAITPPLRGSRRSRAARRRLMRWGAGGRLLRKPTCTLWETPVCPRAGPPPPDRADHSRVKQRIIVAYPEQGLFREKPVGDKPSCSSM